MSAADSQEREVRFHNSSSADIAIYWVDDELDEELAASLGDMEGARAGGPTTPPGADTRVVTRPGEDQDQAPVLPPSTE